MARDIVAVLGTTGVGKSAFAVELAISLGRHAATTTMTPTPTRGVVLSADSMQLYQGLEVITNKVTPGEMRGVEHWGVGAGVSRSSLDDRSGERTPGLGGDPAVPANEEQTSGRRSSSDETDFSGVKVGQGSWEVGRWVTEAWRKIESLNPLTDLPIICGGTHYYTQHFLFPPARLNVARPSSEGSKSENTKWRPPCALEQVLETLDAREPALAERIRTEPGVREFLETFWTPYPVVPDAWRAGPDEGLLAMHRLLGVVDAREAGRWHWRDGRKVRRGLERWWEGLEDMRSGKEEVLVPERSRFRTLMFWVYDDLENLAPRLDSRVDKMVELGLIDEIKQLREQAVRIYGTEQTIDHQEGIFQSIGYKEFSHIPTDRLTPADPLFAPALERMKISTRQYAKRQLKWVQKQMLPVVKQARERGDEVWVYVVRGGDADAPLGEEILHRFLKHEPMPDYRTVGHPKAAELLRVLESEDDNVPEIEQRQVLNARLECDICSTPGQPVTIIKSEWDAHLKSKSHRRSKFRWEQENGLGRDFTAVREEAARRKAQKEEEARLAKERLEQEESLGIS
ncbi:tRNA dimethylallyltransferase, mitochondrial [Naganishia albida]|nr:tRNA dimethylallyltransferase, mitochondrial [Naganishia albida]